MERNREERTIRQIPTLLPLIVSGLNTDGEALSSIIRFSSDSLLFSPLSQQGHRRDAFTTEWDVSKDNELDGAEGPHCSAVDTTIDYSTTEDSLQNGGRSLSLTFLLLWRRYCVYASYSIL